MQCHANLVKVKANPFFPVDPEDRAAARKADSAAGALFLFLFALLCLAKWATFGF